MHAWSQREVVRGHEPDRNSLMEEYEIHLADEVHVLTNKSSLTEAEEKVLETYKAKQTHLQAKQKRTQWRQKLQTECGLHKFLPAHVIPLTLEEIRLFSSLS